MKANTKQILKITFSFVFIALVAGLGSLFVNLGMDWFNSLQRPTQWIPNILIPIVWTVIYIAFATINFFWIKSNKLPQQTAILMIVNGILNILWCLIFFTLKQTFLGNLVIILNLIAGILLWIDIYKNNKLYYYVLSIYPIWLCFATSLNLALWILN